MCKNALLKLTILLLLGKEKSALLFDILKLQIEKVF